MVLLVVNLQRIVAEKPGPELTYILECIHGSALDHLPVSLVLFLLFFPSYLPVCFLFVICPSFCSPSTSLRFFIVCVFFFFSSLLRVSTVVIPYFLYPSSTLVLFFFLLFYCLRLLFFFYTPSYYSLFRLSFFAFCAHFVFRFFCLFSLFFLLLLK